MILRELDDEKSVTDVKKFMEGWFFGTKIESLYKGDIMSWVSAMCFNKRLQQLTTEQLENVEYLVGRFEERLGYSLPEGVDHKAKKMMVTLDPVALCHRPLFFYAAVKCLDIAARSALWKAGFKRSADRGVITYLKQGTSDETPLVFFHGIGIGLFPYLRLIWAMVAKFPNRTIVLFEKTSISMRLDRTLLLPQEYAEKIHLKLKEARIEKIVVVGHSLGTICIRWIDNYIPGIIQSRVFIDPVCFTLWTHDVAQNFMYRSPDKVRHYLLKYFASMEPGISLYLRRYFVWHQNTYFSNQLPTNSKVYLSENDDIVNTPYVYEYLNRFANENRKAEILKGVRHGEHLLSGSLENILTDIDLLS